jgi:hypothetical protein
VIAIPLGPEGGAGQLPGQEEIAGAEVIAELKGRDMGGVGLPRGAGSTVRPNPDRGDRRDFHPDDP